MTAEVRQWSLLRTSARGGAAITPNDGTMPLVPNVGILLPGKGEKE